MLSVGVGMKKLDQHGQACDYVMQHFRFIRIRNWLNLAQMDASSQSRDESRISLRASGLK